MTPNKVEFKGPWDLKIPLFTVVCYFLVLYPTIQFFFRDNHWTPIFAYPCFQALALAIFVRKPRFEVLGWSPLYIQKHLLIGIACGLPMIAVLPLLDTLQSGIALRRPETEWQVDAFISILMLPLLEQSFFTGFFAQALLKRLNPIAAIYFSAVIFTLGHFTLSLGTFFLGFIATGLYFMTGTLYAPTLFQMSCYTAGALLVHNYPHLAAFLGFLL